MASLSQPLPVHSPDIQARPTALKASARPLKILFFYQDFGQMGGIERWLVQTARQLQTRGTVAPVVVCSENSPLYSALQAAGIPVYGVSVPGFFGRSMLRSLDVFSLLRLREILRREQPDCAHVHIGLLENLWIRSLGFPVIYSFHGYSTLYSLQDVKNPLKRAFKLLVRKLFRETAAGMDALLFVSAAEQNRMLHEGFISRERLGEVLHNGIDCEALARQTRDVDQAVAKESLGIPAHARCVSFINRLDANKDPLRFLGLACVLQEPDLHFILAGDGPLMPEVRSLAEDLPNVHVLGHCDNVSELLAISDLVVHPARREGFGLGLLEAMAVGVPCLATASGGAVEILDWVGTDQCLVPVDDEAKFLQAARRLLSLSESERRTLSEKLQARARHFDGARFIERLEAVYQRMLPEISVILPVYNGEDTILRAVASVLNQTYRRLELIVVDDGSCDGTLDALDTIDDERLKVFPRQNQGVAAARNFGFSQARGNYIAFIDADDVWLPEKLAVEMDAIRRAGPEAQAGCLVYSGYYAVDERDRLINLPSIYRQSGDLSGDVLAHEGIFLPSTALVHRHVFETVGGFRTECYHEDRVFFIEACRRFPAYATGQRLVLYRQSLSGRCRGVLKDYERALAAELSIVDTLRERLDPEELEILEIRQLRNLLFRFLMYGELASAQRVRDFLDRCLVTPLADNSLKINEKGLQLPESSPAKRLPADLFAGKKGLLARLSLKTGFNFLSCARDLAQAGYRILDPLLLAQCRQRALRSECIVSSARFILPALPEPSRQTCPEIQASFAEGVAHAGF